MRRMRVSICSAAENLFVRIRVIVQICYLRGKNGVLLLTSDENMLKSSFKQLKDIEEYTFEDKRKINSTVGKLQKQIKHYIKSNDEILTSNSWKVTGALRSLKHKF